MTSVLTQPGLFASLSYAKESVAGTLPSIGNFDILDTETFTPTDDPNITEFPVMRKSRNVIHTTRSGIHKVMLATTAPFFGIQGAPMWAGLIGFDTMSGASPVSAGTTVGAITAGAQTVTLSGSLPAAPAGVNNWLGCWIQIDTGANLEYVQILAIAGAVLTTSAFALAHSTGMAASIPVQHIIQENTGANGPILSTYSMIAQFAGFFEWKMPFCFVSKGGIAGDSKTIKQSWDFVSSNIPVDAVNDSIVQSAGAKADVPWIMRDGGLISNFLQADTVPVMHNRILSLDWELDNGMIAREYGGGSAQQAEGYTPGERRQSLKWKEDLGQNSANPDMWKSYVKTQVSLPMFLSFENAVNSFLFGAYFPNCKVTKYNPVTVMNEPIGFDGEALPLEDGTQGYASRVAIMNNVTTAY